MYFSTGFIDYDDTEIVVRDRLFAAEPARKVFAVLDRL